MGLALVFVVISMPEKPCLDLIKLLQICRDMPVDYHVCILKFQNIFPPDKVIQKMERFRINIFGLNKTLLQGSIKCLTGLDGRNERGEKSYSDSN